MASTIGLRGGLGSVGGTLGQVLVRVGVDTKQLDAGLAKARGEVATTGSTFSKFGSLATVAYAAAGIAAAKFAISVVKAASDQEESLNKVSVVFGEASASVVAFASSSAESFGIAKTAALDAAANFGTMFEAAGRSEEQAAAMSTTFVGLASDLASFFNAIPEDVTGKLTSGLAGAVRPLREYGIFISAARVKTEAYATGIAKVGSELTDAQKVQARYNIIMQDTAKAQGDFARTSDGLANQTRILTAEWEDFKAELGENLTEPAAKSVGFLSGVVRELGVAADETTSFLDTAGQAFGEWAKLFGGGTIATTATYIGTLGELQSAIADAAEAEGQLSNAQRLASQETQAHTKALHEQLIAEKALAGGAVGLLASLDQLKSAQANLNTVRKDGSATAAELRSAELQVLQAQLGVTGSFKDLIDKQKEAGASSADIVNKFQDMAAKAGLTKREIGSLTSFIQAYIDKLKSVPTSVATHFTVTGAGTFQTGGGFARGTNFAPGGMALVGERGPELVNLPRGSQVIPADRTRSAMGGIVVNVSGGTIIGNSAEFRAAVADAVYQAQRRRRSA